MPRIPLTKDEAWLKGTRSKANPVVESPHTGGRPKMPKNLSAVAQEKWKELIKILGKRGTLTKADGTLIELACETYARWRLYIDDVYKRGPYVDETPNASCKLASQMENTLARYLIQLGITPASREKAKQTAPPPPPKNRYRPGSIGWAIQHPEETESEEKENVHEIASESYDEPDE